MEHDINLISHHAETLYVRIFECVYMGVYVKVRKSMNVLIQCDRMSLIKTRLKECSKSSQ